LPAPERGIVSVGTNGGPIARNVPGGTVAEDFEMETRDPAYARVRIAFASSSYFHRLPASSLDALTALATLERCGRGGLLQEFGAYKDKFWLVVEGGVRVSWPNARGQPVPVAVIGPGSFYSLAAFAEGAAAPAECRTERDTVFASIPGPRLRDLIQADADLQALVPHLLLQRFQAAVSFYADAVSAPLADRIARRLHNQAIANRRNPSSREIELRISQSDLAQIVGSSRSKVNAELRRLQDARVLRLGYRRLYVTDCKKLGALAGGFVAAF
jgi:CRP/FNR family transcriptional regulator, cyclic AMP receptor protein